MKGPAIKIFLVLLLASTGISAEAEVGGYDVVVIGAGGGGLGAGAALSLGGMKALVIEQHEKVGGYMTGFERWPYTFEVSLHAINGVDSGGMSRALYEELDIMDRLRPVRFDPAYTAVYPDLKIEVPADAGAYREILEREFPNEKQGIKEFYKIMGNMRAAIEVMTLYRQKNHLGAIGAFLKKPSFLVTLSNWGPKSMAELLDHCTDDQRLQTVLAWLCGYAGGTPDEVPATQFMGMWASYHYNGYYYFEGGSQAISDALAEVIIENGGEIKLDTLVTKIVIEDGKAVAVRTKDGSEYRCRYVVSNANAPDTFNKLVGSDHLPPEFLEKLNSREIGPSIFQIFLGVDHDYTGEFNGSHTISVHETYDQSENYRAGLEDGDPERVAYFIVNYSVVDPGVAPEGKNVIEFTSYLPYDWKHGWYEDVNYEKYDALKTETAMIFVKRAEKFLPGLSEHIEIMEVGSPRTMEHYTLNPKGSVYGFALTESRLPQETPIPNLYLAGAWVSGGGQSSVIASGYMAAQKILKKGKSDR